VVVVAAAHAAPARSPSPADAVVAAAHVALARSPSPADAAAAVARVAPARSPSPADAAAAVGRVALVRSRAGAAVVVVAELPVPLSLSLDVAAFRARVVPVGQVAAPAPRSAPSQDPVASTARRALSVPAESVEERLPDALARSAFAPRPRSG